MASGVRVTVEPSGRASTSERTWRPKLPAAVVLAVDVGRGNADRDVAGAGGHRREPAAGTTARMRSSSDVPASIRAVPAASNPSRPGHAGGDGDRPAAFIAESP